MGWAAKAENANGTIICLWVAQQMSSFTPGRMSTCKNCYQLYFLWFLNQKTHFKVAAAKNRKVQTAIKDGVFQLFSRNHSLNLPHSDIAKNKYYGALLPKHTRQQKFK